MKTWNKSSVYLHVVVLSFSNSIVETARVPVCDQCKFVGDDAGSTSGPRNADFLVITCPQKKTTRQTSVALECFLA